MENFIIKKLFLIYQEDKLINILKNYDEANEYIKSKQSYSITSQNYITYYDLYYEGIDNYGEFYVFILNDTEHIIIEGDFGQAICMFYCMYPDKIIKTIEHYHFDFYNNLIINKNFNYPKLIKNLFSKITTINNYFVSKLINYMIDYCVDSEDSMKEFESKYNITEEKIVRSIFSQISIYDILTFEGFKIYKKLCNKIENDYKNRMLWIIITLIFLNNDLVLIYQAYKMVIDGNLDKMLMLL